MFTRRNRDEFKISLEIDGIASSLFAAALILVQIGGLAHTLAIRKITIAECKDIAGLTLLLERIISTDNFKRLSGNLHLGRMYSSNRGCQSASCDGCK